jgi:uncharacterized protein (DUF2267 family)
MATTGLEVFDRTLHATNLWLDEICAEIGPDKHLAWHVLGAVLRSIRDELLIGQSVADTLINIGRAMARAAVEP